VFVAVSDADARATGGGVGLRPAHHGPWLPTGLRRRQRRVLAILAMLGPVGRVCLRQPRRGALCVALGGSGRSVASAPSRGPAAFGW